MKKSLILLVFAGLAAGVSIAVAGSFTDAFPLQNCSFTSTGKNPFFVLEPGYQLTLEGKDGEDAVRLTITVLDETKIISGIETRIVKERETVNGELVEISKNYFAICKKNNSVFYFGEDVNNYDGGVLINHDGSWRHGVNGAHAGLIMPGIALLGAKYYQEVAPDVALDRAQIVKVTAVVSTPAGEFHNCLGTKETTPLEPDALEYKFYAPSIGLIKDAELELVNVSTVAGPE
ncbi:MAG TPA: hypothetical protein VI958_05305 [Acidobacteriota bacterium]